MWGRVATVGDFGHGRDDDRVRPGDAKPKVKKPKPGEHPDRKPIARPKPVKTLKDIDVTAYLCATTHDPAGSYLDDLRAYEWIAEGHWALRTIRATLPPGLLAVVDAVYTVPSTPELEDRKRQACEDVTGRALRANTYGKPRREFVRAVVYDWIGAQELAPGAWAKALKVDVKTLHRYRYGRGRWGKGIQDRLDDWLVDAVDNRLRRVMLARGVIAR